MQPTMFEVNGEHWLFDSSGKCIYPPDPEPYDQCWCGSGAKFKFCHKGRHLEEPLTTEQWVREWEETCSLRICLHPRAPEGCSPLIVAAHSIQRSGGGLKAIARNGKVLGGKMHPMYLEKTSGKIVPELIGVAHASTFHGFCQTHDTALFAPVETCPFEASRAQLLLLNFRAVAIGHYVDQIVLRQLPYLAKHDRGRPPSEQRQMYVMLQTHKLRSEESLRYTQLLRSLYGEAITGGNAPVNALIVNFTGMPELMCLGLAPLDCTFIGSVHDLYQDASSHLCFYTLATPQGWSAIFSWLGENPVAAEICRSIFAVPEDERPDAILHYALEYIDNIYLSPAWWDRLARDQQNVVASLMSDHVKVFTRRKPDALENRPFAIAQSVHHSTVRIGSWA